MLERKTISISRGDNAGESVRRVLGLISRASADGTTVAAANSGRFTGRSV